MREMVMVVVIAAVAACGGSEEAEPDAGPVDADASAPVDSAPSDADPSPDAEWDDECVTVDDCHPQYDDCVRGRCMYVDEPCCQADAEP